MHHLIFVLGGVQPETVCSAGSVFVEGKDVGVTVFVFVRMCRCRCWGVGSLCAALLCVSNPSVFNEISHFLLFFILIPFLARTQGSRIHSHSFFLFPFSLYSAVLNLLLSPFSVQQERSSASDCHSASNWFRLIYHAMKSQHAGQNDTLFSMIVIA